MNFIIGMCCVILIIGVTLGLTSVLINTSVGHCILFLLFITGLIIFTKKVVYTGGIIKKLIKEIIKNAKAK